VTHKSILVLTAIAALSTTSLVPAHAATRGAVHTARAASHRPAAVRPMTRHVILHRAASTRRVTVKSAQPHPVQSSSAGVHKTASPPAHSTNSQNGPGHAAQNSNSALNTRRHVFAGPPAGKSAQTPANGTAAGDAKSANNHAQIKSLLDKAHDAQDRAKREISVAKSDREQAQVARDEAARLRRAAEQKLQGAEQPWQRQRLG
jgi:hypothetical protein